MIGEQSLSLTSSSVWPMVALKNTGYMLDADLHQKAAFDKKPGWLVFKEDV
jgi:hypothetical protein